MPRLLLVLLLALVATPGAAADVLTIHRPPIPLEGKRLDLHGIFARIDSLTERYDASDGIDRGRLARRLAELHLATGMMKHRPYAVDLLDEAAHLGADPRGAIELKGQTLHTMRFVSKAQEDFERLTEIAPDDPSVSITLGRFHFIEARRRMTLMRFEKAAQAFARVTQIDPDDAEGWFGRAASELALRHYEESATAARELLARREDWPTARLLVAAADQGRGEFAVAWREFHSAFAQLPIEVTTVFTRAEGFVRDEDLVRVARDLLMPEDVVAGAVRVASHVSDRWDVVLRTALRDSTVHALALARLLEQDDGHPTRDYRVGPMRFWTRLIEADVLFGDPETGERGWESSMGDALVRWGRPNRAYYHPGDGPVMETLLAHGFTFPPDWEFSSSIPQIVWGYDGPAASFSLVFFDPVRQDHFTYGGRTRRLVEQMKQTTPILLQEEQGRPSPFQVALSRAVFPRGNDEAVLETYLALRIADTDSAAMVSFAQRDTVARIEWAILDGSGRRVDHREEILDQRARRSALNLAAGLDTVPDPAEPWLWSVGAVLPAGPYRVAVGVSTPDGRGLRSAELNVDVPPTESPALLEMSDLQIATHLGRFRPSSEIPSRFVKFGRIVLPAPDLRIPEGAATMAVYFELRHLGLDDAARTHFDVTYEVYRGEQTVRRILSKQVKYVSGDLERVHPLTSTFLEERTGVSGQGLVVKGTELDVSDLWPGDYVLRVVIRDHSDGAEIARSLPFRKQGL